MFKLSGCYPSLWQDIGEYETVFSALCAMANRTEDYENMVILNLDRKMGQLRIAHYTADGIK